MVRSTGHWWLVVVAPRRSGRRQMSAAVRTCTCKPCQFPPRTKGLLSPWLGASVNAAQHLTAPPKEWKRELRPLFQG
jgi:hypothetical protein